MPLGNLLNLHLLHEGIQVFRVHPFLDIVRDIDGFFIGCQALAQEELFVLSRLI